MPTPARHRSGVEGANTKAQAKRLPPPRPPTRPLSPPASECCSSHGQHRYSYGKSSKRPSQSSKGHEHEMSSSLSLRATQVLGLVPSQPDLIPADIEWLRHAADPKPGGSYLTARTLRRGAIPPRFRRISPLAALPGPGVVCKQRFKPGGSSGLDSQLLGTI